MSQILIIEDEPKIAAFIEKGLKQSGHFTTVAQDGCEAWALSCSETFDLILLDLGLPDQNGLELLKELRQAGMHQPVMVLTAWDDPAYRKMGDRYGASEYLLKPFRFVDLLQRVEALL